MSTRSVALSSSIEADLSSYPDINTGDREALPHVYAASLLRQDIIRKWIPDDSKDIDAATFRKFKQMNSRCEKLNRFFKKVGPSLNEISKWEIDRIVYGEFRRNLYDFFHKDGNPIFSSHYDILDHMRSGPGVSLKANGTSFYTKYFSSSLTVTNQHLYTMYKEYIKWYPRFQKAEQVRSEAYGHPITLDGSRMTFVPKTAKSSRLICIEPSLNMLYQLGLASIMGDRLKQFFGIDLSNQPVKNKQMAQVGSLDGSFSTIDLSSASDCVSLGVCELFLPRNIFTVLCELRSPNSSYTDSKGVTHSFPLHMMSTMGNGFTFPLQTIIFASLAKAVITVFRKHRLSFSTFAVFGDDIIVPSEFGSKMLHYLRRLGFKPNPSKTFLEGPFRESCGGDFYKGHLVRSVFVKKLSSLQDIYVAVNLLNEWSSYTGICLPNSVGYLLSLIPRKFRIYVPYSENNDSGLKVPSTFLTSLTKDSNGSFVYRRFLSRPSKIFIKEGGLRAPRKLAKKLIFNPDGLEIAFLYGEVDNMSISIRHDRVRYVTNVATVPNWDWKPSLVGSTGDHYTWHMWETCVPINFGNP